MSTLAVIVVAVVAVLLLAMLVASGRKAGQARAHHLGPTGDESDPYRSHAEASRRGDGQRL